MRAASDAWMTPPATTDPTYSDPAVAATWLADVVARAKAQGKGRASKGVGRAGAGEAQPDVATPPAADRGDDA